MALEVPCPNCKAVLRAPDEAVGRKVKCKKCDHRFAIPGGDRPADSVADSQMLSAIEMPTTKPTAMAMPPAPSVALTKSAPIKMAALIADPIEVLTPDGEDLPTATVSAPAGDPFSFDAAPVKNGKKPDRREAPAPVPAADGDAFAFDASAPATKSAVADDDDEVSEEARPKKSKAKSGGGKKLVLVLVGAFGLMCLGMGGAAAAVYFFVVNKAKATLAEVDAKSKETPPDAAKAKEPSTKETQGKDKDAKGKEAESPGPKPGIPPKVRRTPKNATPPVSPPEAPMVAAPTFTLPGAPVAKVELIARKKETIALELPATAVRGVRFATGDPPVAAVLWRSVEGFQGAGAKDTIDLYAIRTLRRVERVDFPADGFTRDRAFDISPAGDRIALEGPPGKLTVYEFGSKQKPLDGLDPFAGSPQRFGSISAIRFVNDDLVAVFDSAGSVDVFDVKSKARSAMGPPPPSMDKKAPSAAVSDVASAKVLVFARGAVAAISPQNGTTAAVSVAVGDPSIVPLGVAVDHGFKKAAVVYRTPSADPPHTLAIVALNGSKPNLIPLPAEFGTPAGVRFVGEAAVAVLSDDRSSALLFDLEGNAMVGYLKRPNEPAVQIPDGTAGRYWWIVPDPMDAKKSVFTSVEMPFDEYFKLAGEAKGNKKPIFLVPRADGLGR